MKTNKATQTNPSTSSGFSFKSANLDSDPLSISCANIVSIVRNVEAQLMAAIGLQKKSPEGGTSNGVRTVRGYEEYILQGASQGQTAPRRGNLSLSDSASLQLFSAPVVTEELVDEFVRHRIAALASTIVRQAEENIVEELTRITQLVPLSKEGGTYARAPLISSPPPLYSPTKSSERVSPARGAPGAARPAVPRDVEHPATRGRPAATSEGTERLQALMDLVRSPRAASPARRDEPTFSSSDARITRQTGNYYDKPQTNTEHQRRMQALQQLADKFAKPQSISQYTPPAPRTDVQQIPGGFEFSSSRARQYAEQLTNLVDAAVDETASLSSSGFADVRPTWRGAF